MTSQWAPSPPTPLTESMTTSLTEGSAGIVRTRARISSSVHFGMPPPADASFVGDAPVVMTIALAAIARIGIALLSIDVSRCAWSIHATIQPPSKDRKWPRPRAPEDYPIENVVTLFDALISMSPRGPRNVILIYLDQLLRHHSPS